MRRILLSLGFTIAAVFAGDLGVCQKNCGLDFGKCLITTGDFETCLVTEAGCAVDCLKSVSVQNGHKRNQVTQKDMGVCQKNCGIDYGKCLITTFDINSCTTAEASCALDCLKGVKSHKKFQVKANSAVGVCEKDCGISFGQCLINTGDFKECLKGQANCALDCLKGVSSEVQVAQSQDMGVCQKNCAIDYSKCLITTFDMATCITQEASCALDCLKGVEVEVMVEDAINAQFSLKCTACKFGAGKIEGIISKMGCGASDVAITVACETVFLGPEDPVADACAAGFIAVCPTLLSWIEKKVFSPEKACGLIRLC